MAATTPNQIAKTDRLVWVDCEMTGLDPDRHVLVEIAVVVTDAELRPLDEGIDIVIHATEEELAGMDDFVTEMHRKSGLTEEIRASSVSVADAESQVVEYLRRFVPVAGVAPLCGNSIASDRKFISTYMPDLDSFLHYRMIDVSSIKELTRRWYPRVYSGQPAKGMQHRALADILESVRELDYYRRAVFTAAPGPDQAAVDAAATAAVEATPIA
ncbi:oligoribonuclease [Corynebacterium terpenotabidum]|uniref:Oligoribonuclease n=1 Tax=Corynebacterium terpenotabidum Y-11 TaxID=1200352 RepID=S4XFD1_9CORY|nr:oligoribonuclease [Corynebacterium terpenotabidum]AGP30330.1 oligoribonuclease [Corynebacterium terpenotabidum Y-11]